MGEAHRQDDPRACGAKTVVEGQSSVYIDGKLWAVHNDPNSHGNGRLQPEHTSIKINGKRIVDHTPDNATADNAGHTPAQTKTAGGANSVKCYGS